MIDRGFFSHCIGGEANTSCPQSGYDFVARDQAAGIDVQAPGTTVAENLPLNNDPVDTAAAQTNRAWLNSPEHKANILNTPVTMTGVGAVCCFVGNVAGQQVTTIDRVMIYVQEFSGGPGAVAPAAVAFTSVATVAGTARSSAAPAGSCQFILGFQTLQSLNASAVGECTDNQAFGANGDAQQTTTHGLMAWRKADSWTAFTNGYWTWVNGPTGLAQRLNTQRFAWEANPDGLPQAP